MTARKPTRARKLGVTDEQYGSMLVAQQGRCAIPGCPRTPKTRRFAVDHDHRTGAVRALLCHVHNRYLPAWITPEDLRHMADYLEHHRG